LHSQRRYLGWISARIDGYVRLSETF